MVSWKLVMNKRFEWFRKMAQDWLQNVCGIEVKDWDEGTELENPGSTEAKAELVGKLNKYWLPILGESVSECSPKSKARTVCSTVKETPQY